MLTALKRIAYSKTDTAEKSRCRPMPTTLQTKFSRGVQYNMKIVIKGDKGSGKTSLFRRLQGKAPEEEYKTTEEIQVANVHWNYKNVEDVIKVEVWDVVDRGRQLCLNAASLQLNAALDAEFVDVYKGTNGVIIVMDVTKSWTFSYVQSEIPKAPRSVPILVLGNRCDMAHHRQVSEDAVRSFVDSVQRPGDQAQIRYAESSMVNGFGLRYIYKFLALPFLHLQRTVLQSQLERNAEEIRIASREIDDFQTSDDGDYEKFSSQLSLKRRRQAEHLGVGLNSSGSRTPSVIFGLGRPINRCGLFQKSTQPRTEAKTIEEFIPDEERFDDSFFGDPPSDLNLPEPGDQCSDSDSQCDGNPLVAQFQEDIDSNDEFHCPISVDEFESGEYFKSESRTEETAQSMDERSVQQKGKSEKHPGPSKSQRKLTKVKNDIRRQRRK